MNVQSLARGMWFAWVGLVLTASLALFFFLRDFSISVTRDYFTHAETLRDRAYCENVAEICRREAEHCRHPEEADWKRWSPSLPTNEPSQWLAERAAQMDEAAALYSDPAWRENLARRSERTGREERSRMTCTSCGYSSGLFLVFVGVPWLAGRTFVRIRQRVRAHRGATPKLGFDR